MAFLPGGLPAAGRQTGGQHFFIPTIEIGGFQSAISVKAVLRKQNLDEAKRDLYAVSAEGWPL